MEILALGRVTSDSAATACATEASVMWRCQPPKDRPSKSRRPTSAPTLSASCATRPLSLVRRSSSGTGVRVRSVSQMWVGGSSGSSHSPTRSRRGWSWNPWRAVPRTRPGRVTGIAMAREVCRRPEAWSVHSASRRSPLTDSRICRAVSGPDPNPGMAGAATSQPVSEPALAISGTEIASNPVTRRRASAPGTSKTTGRDGICQLRRGSRTDAAAHSSGVALITSVGMPARRLRAWSSVHRSDRNRRQFTGTLSSSDADQRP
ncbi:hypothetical protein GCM10009837_85310 [Streptomyces durmitorensis]